MSAELAGPAPRAGSRRRTLALSIVVLLLALAGGANAGRGDIRLWLLLGAFVAGAAVFANHRAAVFLILLSVFLFGWLSSVLGVLPRQATWLPELALIALSLRLMLEVPRKREVRILPADLALACLLLIGLVSSLANLERATVLAVGLRNYFKFVPLFYAIRWLDFDDDFLRRMLKALVAVALVQVPVAAAQRALSFGLETGDIIGGTLGANTSGTLTLFLLCIISLVAGAYLNGLIDTKRLLALMALLFVPMVINETKITFILFPLLALFLFGKRAGFPDGMRRAAVPLAASAVILLAGLVAYNTLYPGFFSSGEGLLGKEQLGYVTSERTKSGSLNRVAQLRFADRHIRKGASTAVFGVGPGNASDSFFGSGVGLYYRKYRLLEIDSLLGGRLLWEYGYLGSAIFVFLFVYFWLAASSLAARSPDPLRRSLAVGFQGILIVAAVSAFYSGSILIPALGFVFWFAGGYVLRWQAEETNGRPDEEHL
ncbi:MAG: hypothetical protein C4521_13090 [Actinobacteria bacterium]|nr:MAG: hypothetical protein C4521_13090 [Actinomycetota bacterium]